MGLGFGEENKDEKQEGHLGGLPPVLARIEDLNQENC